VGIESPKANFDARKVARRSVSVVAGTAQQLCYDILIQGRTFKFSTPQACGME
jgi:hypothetical protein